MAVNEEVIIGGTSACDPGHKKEKEEISRYNGEYPEWGDSVIDHAAKDTADYADDSDDGNRAFAPFPSFSALLIDSYSEVGF